MPLNGEQKRTIEDSISHLFDFSADQNEFANEEAGLVYALTNPVEQSHPFYWLRQCLIHPEAHFQNLLKQGPKITTGEVQKHIIDFIDSSLLKTGHVLGIWDKEQVLATLPAENWMTDFTSIQAPVDSGENPWQLPALPGKIYAQELRIQVDTEIVETEEDDPFQIDTRTAYVDVIINLPNKAEQRRSVKIRDITEVFRDDEQENRYLETLKEPAEREARNCAAETAISALVKKHKFSFQTIARARNSQAAKAVITDEFYYQLLYQGTLALSAITNITDIQADILCRPGIISLMKRNLLMFADAEKLTLAEARVLTHPVYHDLLEKGLLNLQQIKGISDRRSKFIVHPHVTSLIQRGKLTCQQACVIPIHLKDILCSDLYITFFIKNDINWEQFAKIRENHHLALLNKNIARYVNNRITTLEMINDSMQQSENPQTALFYLYIHTFASRLYWILNQNPYLIDSNPDTVKLLDSDIAAAAMECNSHLHQFKEWIFFYFISYLRNHIEKRISEPEAETVIYENMLKIITPTATATSIDWSEVFSQLIHQCKLTLRVNRFRDNYSDVTPYLNNSLFYRESAINPHDKSHYQRKRLKISESDTQALALCSSIIALSPLESTTTQPTMLFHI